MLWRGWQLVRNLRHLPVEHQLELLLAFVPKLLPLGEGQRSGFGYRQFLDQLLDLLAGVLEVLLEVHVLALLGLGWSQLTLWLDSLRQYECGLD